jgi:hypothetical protein
MIDKPLLLALKGLNSQVVTAGKSVVASEYLATGGYIINPATAADQGLTTLNILYVDPTGPAAATETATTIAVPPGSTYKLPPNPNLGVWVNSNASGHKFTVVQIVPRIELEDEYIKGPFPPDGPTGVTNNPIPSYLYQEYTPDNDLQAFVAAFNSMQQDIIDTFNGLNLPIYTQDPVSSALLDWVGQGVYGYKRPYIYIINNTPLGPLNTYTFNPEQNVGPIPINMIFWTQPQGVGLSDDDLYRRCLTWHISKREGKYFNVEWLKKRVAKFCYGENGTQPNIDQTYQISVTFGIGFEVTIRFVLYVRTVIGGAICNMFGCNGTAAILGMIASPNNVIPLNTIFSTLVTLPDVPYMQQFKEAVQCNVLELPFQFQYVVQIG